MNLCFRKIVDGEGSRTVLNGNGRGQDLLYTMENYHISGTPNTFVAGNIVRSNVSSFFVGHLKHGIMKTSTIVFFYIVSVPGFCIPVQGELKGRQE